MQYLCNILCHEYPAFAFEEFPPSFGSDFEQLKVKGIIKGMKSERLVKSYITDDKGNVESVISDYKTFKNIEEILLDIGLGKATKEVAEDEDVDLEEAVRIAGFKK